MVESYVFDSSTLILLAKISILRDFAKEKEVIITQKVKLEVLKKKTLQDARIIQNLIENNVIKVSETKLSTKKIEQDFRLGVGKTEVIALAL